MADIKYYARSSLHSPKAVKIYNSCGMYMHSYGCLELSNNYVK